MKMIKYKAHLKPRKSKRLTEMKIFLNICDGFFGYSYNVIPKNLKIDYMENTIEFEIQDDILQYPSDVIDGHYFRIYVEYSNPHSPRTETYVLVGEKV